MTAAEGDRDVLLLPSCPHDQIGRFVPRKLPLANQCFQQGPGCPSSAISHASPTAVASLTILCLGWVRVLAPGPCVSCGGLLLTRLEHGMVTPSSKFLRRHGQVQSPTG
jgi:hypothetical protein